MLYNDDPEEMLKTIEALLPVPSPELALRLYLQCAEDSKAQVTAIHLIIGVLQRMNVFGAENRDTLTHKATGALLCLKRALRIASAAQQMANAISGTSGPVTLFVEILNKYLYFLEKGFPQITSAAIQVLVELITNEMKSDSTPDPASDAFFASTIRYIQFQKQKDGVMGEKFGPIKM
ncbi:hypothetical protein SADUNF_Sadunf05G0183700 [Salix dunnii]|uniref:Uncharacterized protein n=1 Tax=Salix dunnii TaxID=1413687 RepID=A0A835KC02_9ROSI|nr:hypothetical protein SADUNF_Sadunf05G0183700 [Salix dunnii]